jgi:hypothetical protein
MKESYYLVGFISLALCHYQTELFIFTSYLPLRRNGGMEESYYLVGFISLAPELFISLLFPSINIRHMRMGRNGGIILSSWVHRSPILLCERDNEITRERERDWIIYLLNT